MDPSWTRDDEKKAAELVTKHGFTRENARRLVFSRKAEAEEADAERRELRDWWNDLELFERVVGGIASVAVIFAAWWLIRWAKSITGLP